MMKQKRLMTHRKSELKKSQVELELAQSKTSIRHQRIKALRQNHH